MTFVDFPNQVRFLLTVATSSIVLRDMLHKCRLTTRSLEQRDGNSKHVAVLLRKH